MRKIIIACKNNLEINIVLNSLNKNDYSMVDRVHNTRDLIRSIKQYNPDSIIIYGKIDNNQIYIDEILSFYHVPVIVLESEINKTLYYNYLNDSRFLFLDKIELNQHLNISLELMIKSNMSLNELTNKLDKALSENSALKKMNKAKFYLMEKYNIKEDVAHKIIVSTAMKERMTKEKISERLLNNEIDIYI